MHKNLNAVLFIPDDQHHMFFVTFKPLRWSQMVQNTERFPFILLTSVSRLS